ncbi:MAG: helix-turn-helix domain-containing protein [Candidatus Dojkabacteria bacterium]|jgi:ArsR family transcriptional regulator|nr:helix-turn-helix domain-containing protein [Candidatus Dojkabacteria bacterium]
MNSSRKIKPDVLSKLLENARIKILSMLYQKDTCACEIVNKTKLKNNLISHHLKVLTDMGYIEAKRNGKHMMYNLRPCKRDIVREIFELIDRKDLNY